MSSGPVTTDRVVYDGLTVSLTPAPTLKRFVAYAVDLSCTLLLINLTMFSLISVGAPFLVVYYDLQKKNLDAVWLNRIGVGALVLYIVFFALALLLVFHGWFVYYEYKTGTTPGKKLFGLKVVPHDRDRLSFGQCVLRDLFRYVDCMLVLPGLISLTASKLKRRLGDLAASTMVVYSAQRETENSSTYLSDPDYQLMLETMKPQAVPREVALKYLEFAFSEFITSGKESPNEILLAWMQTAKTYLPEWNVADGKPRVTLRFFAEWCLRSLNPSFLRK